jgi:lipid-binding SYLF domain-containing protein
MIALSPHRSLHVTLGRAFAATLAIAAALPGAAQVVAPPVAGPPVAVAPVVTSEEQRLVADASVVFDEMLAIPAGGIPRSMLAGAEAVAVIPRVVKGGFIVGARYGRGVVIAKDAQGVWHTPMFLTITGGNIGWQAGVQATDLVLVYRSRRSVDSLMSGKLTIGADAAAAAGPVGREASAATDTSFTAEVYTYSRSRGLFAGVSLDGSVLKIDHAATDAYYRPVGGAQVIPVEAQQLTAKIVATTTPAQPAATTAPAPEPTAAPSPFAAPASPQESEAIRDQLAEFAPRLFRLLDPQWQSFLALPASIFQEAGHPTPAEIDAAAARFQTIATDPRYANLAALPEFQTTRGLVLHYAQLLQNTPRTLTLPPPPAQ